ncbi:MAG: DMT family transporter [Sporomusaceae bacterium]|nr:DMT family transporter [Sporomusaceae bacterium]
MTSKTLSGLILVFGVFALSTSAIFVKLADAPSSITAFYRLFFAALLLLPLALNKENRQALLTLSRRQWQFSLLSGLLLSTHYVLWFESLRYTSVASSTVIVTLQPLFSISAGYCLFNERFSKGALAGCAVAIAGCFIIGWRDFQVSEQALFGDLLAFAAAGLITAYFFVSQHVRQGLSVVPYSMLGYVSSSVFLGLYALVQQAPFSGYSLQTWESFIGLALIATILGQMIFNWLLKWVSTTLVSMSILGETIGTCILAYFILGETISLQQGIGIAVILTGLALYILNAQQRPADSRESVA